MTPIPTIYHADPRVMGAVTNMLKEEAGVRIDLEVIGGIILILSLLLRKWIRAFFRSIFRN
jgi:hypothetical protein